MGRNRAVAPRAAECFYHSAMARARLLFMLCVSSILFLEFCHHGEISKKKLKKLKKGNAIDLQGRVADSHTSHTTATDVRPSRN